jgi:serine protease
MMPTRFPKRLLTALLLGLCFCGGLLLATWRPIAASAQTDASELFYRFNGDPVALVVQENAIAVAFQSAPSGNRSTQATPLYQQLQQDLNATGTRGDDTITVQPVGTRYAIATLPTGSLSSRGDLRSRLQLPYVATTLAVVNRPGEAEQILLPNEVIVSFAANTPEVEQRLILAAQGLALIRPLRFTENRVLARLRTPASETAILTVAEQLNQVAGVRSVTPNFIPVRSPLAPPEESPLAPPEEEEPNVNRGVTRSTPGSLTALAWHLDSTAMAPGGNNRGVKAPAAWALGSRGRGVTVAVIDAFVQWEHPALINNTYGLPAGAEGLPGERHGWDFVDDDPAPQAEAQELAILRSPFQETFSLADADLLQKYRADANRIQQRRRNLSDPEVAQMIRNYIRSSIVGEFHGTTVAGVIAANAGETDSRETAFLGIAPDAKILPIRAAELGGGFPTVPAVEAIGYAAARGVDVINMSWGSMMPSTAIADAITEALAANPNLIMVAAAGNDGENRVGFPAGLRHVISVGASTLQGTRAPYSSYGPGLTLVAPGGYMNAGPEGGFYPPVVRGMISFGRAFPFPISPGSRPKTPRETMCGTRAPPLLRQRWRG